MPKPTFGTQQAWVLCVGEKYAGIYLHAQSSLIYLLEGLRDKPTASTAFKNIPFLCHQTGCTNEVPAAVQVSTGAITQVWKAVLPKTPAPCLAECAGGVTMRQPKWVFSQQAEEEGKRENSLAYTCTSAARQCFKSTV